MFIRHLVVRAIKGDSRRIHKLDISNEQTVKIHGYIQNCVLEGKTEDLTLNLEKFQGMIDLTKIRADYVNIICSDLPVKILVSEDIGGFIEIVTDYPQNTRIYEVSGISENILFYCSGGVSHVSADFGTFENMTINVCRNAEDVEDVAAEDVAAEGLFSGNITTLLVGKIGRLCMEQVLFASDLISKIEATFVKMETNAIPNLGPSVSTFELRVDGELKKSRPIPTTVSSLRIFNCNWISAIADIDNNESRLQSLAIDGYFEPHHLNAIPKCVKSLEIFDVCDHSSDDGDSRRGGINFPKIVDLSRCCGESIRNFTYTTYKGIPFRIVLNSEIEDLTVNCTKSTEYQVVGLESAKSLRVVRVAGNPTFDHYIKFGSQVTTILAPHSFEIQCVYDRQRAGVVDDLIHFVPNVPYSEDIAEKYADSGLRWLVADSGAIVVKSMPERHYLHLAVADFIYNLSANCAERCVLGYTDFERKPDRDLIKWIKDMKRCIRHHSGETPENQCGAIISKPAWADNINVIWR